MKPVFRILALIIGLLGLFTTQLRANPVRGSVMVLAKETVDDDKKAKNGGTQIVTIDITVNGKPVDPETRVIKWTAYGKDQKTGDMVSMDSGEIPLNLSAGSTQKTATKKMTTTYKEEQKVVSKTGSGKNKQSKTKEVPGSGVKYYGYAIEVLDGGVVIGSKYDPRSLEKKK